MKTTLVALLLALVPRAAAAALSCDLSQYKAGAGPVASVSNDLLAVSWHGDADSELRARFEIVSGQPVIHDLDMRTGGGTWVTLGDNLKPEYRVVTGVRRMSNQQADPLRAAGVELTPEIIAKNRWYAFWDAPLYLPPAPAPGAKPAASRVLGPPRSADEIQRAAATFYGSSCRVVTDGASLSVAF